MKTQVMTVLSDLSATKSRNEKAKILKAVVSDLLLTDVMHRVVRYAYDAEYDYGIKKFKKSADHLQVAEFGEVFDLLDKLRERQLSGNAAKSAVEDLYHRLDSHGAEIFVRMLSHDLKCGVGPETFNKNLGECVYVHPYRKCSGFSKANLKKINLPAISQVKMDGAYNDVYVYPDKIQIISRNGLEVKYKLQPHLMAAIAIEAEGYVLAGEALVWSEDRTRLLPRDEGNGYLSSDDIDLSRICLVFWDAIPIEEHRWDTVSTEIDIDRFNRLVGIVNNINHVSNDQIRVVETRIVNSVDDIIKHFRESIERGEEGTVVKNFAGKWEHGESADCVKIKIVFDCDLEIVDVVEGTGKNQGRMGALILRTVDNKLMVNVGIGFSDKQRDDFYQNKENLPGCIVTVKANEITSKANSDVSSLFLPRFGSGNTLTFVEIRKDKRVADTLQQVIDQRNAVYDIIKSMTD